jgi:hypothetical protein
MLLARETEGANRKPMGLGSHEYCQVRVYSGDCGDCGDCDGCGSGCDWGNTMAKAQAAAVRHRSQNPGYVRRARGKEAAVLLSYRLLVSFCSLCSSLSSCFYIIIRGQETHASNLLVLDLMMLT